MDIEKRWHWDISKTDDGLEALSHVESSDNGLGDFEGHKTANAAFTAGLKKLREHSEGMYMLEVWCYVTELGCCRPPKTEYDHSFLAVIKDGKVTRY